MPDLLEIGRLPGGFISFQFFSKCDGSSLPVLRSYRFEYR